MKRQTKYTHITERCSSIIKAFASLQIEQQTSDTVSAAYWRLREGKGLLTPFDRESLDQWCQVITDVRKYAASPYPLEDKLRQQLKDRREALIEKMEEYRDWIAFGSIPTYMYENSIRSNITKITLEYCLSGMLVRKSGMYPNEIPAEELKGWLKEIDIQELIYLSNDYATKFPNLADYQLRYFISEYKGWPAGFKELQADKAWQIRTDMEHRSSVGAKINERLAWIHEVETKTTEHREVITQCMVAMLQFKIWKEKQRAAIKMAKGNGEKPHFNEQDVFMKVSELLNRIEVPEFTPIE